MSLRENNKRDAIRDSDDSNRWVCDECGGKVIVDEERAEEICSDCGVIVSTDKIDHGPEWRKGDDEESKSRVGQPLTARYHDRGLSSEISYSNYDAKGNRISPEQRRKMDRLRKVNKWNKTTDERTLSKALGEIQRVATSLSIPKSVVNIASVIQRKVQREGLLYGRSIEASAGATLYLACKMEHISRTFGEISSVSRIQEKRIRKMNFYIIRELDLEVPPTPPAEFIPRFISSLDATQDHETEAKRLLQSHANMKNLSGHAPSVLAATSIYTSGITLNEMISQHIIADVAGISVYSIRDEYKEMLKNDPQVNIDIDTTSNGYTTHPAEFTTKINDIDDATYYIKDE